MKKYLGFSLLTALLAFVSFGTFALAQSTTAGDIAGTITDPTGATIPNAQIKVVNIANGSTKISTSSSSGSYRVALLNPGTYKVQVMAAGFGSSSTTVTVSAGTVTPDDVKLTIGSSSTVVEVSAAPEIVNTTNADVQTVFTAEQVQSLPNPGNDLTFVAQTAPGSVMNTGTMAGGYGNFSSFGISGLSNMFTLDGGYENDPFLNLNNTGASNLTLGNNEVDTVTVISPAYSSQYGGLGGAQVNEITTSGSNRLHGNASYYWNGRALNSNDWFNKQNQAYFGEKNQAAFVNVNQYAASIGGPIFKDKLFFFVNTEGIRATTPQQGQVFAPNALFNNCINGNDPGGTVVVAGAGPQTYSSCATLNSIADAGCVDGSNAANVGNLCDGIPFSAPSASQAGLMGRVASAFTNSPFRPAASGVVQDPDDPALVSYFAHSAELLTEWLLTARIDYKIGDKDNFYIHYKQDHGLQPTYTDLISPLFTAQSPQPSWEGQINETHSFTPNFSNQLVLTGNYYSAPFQNNNSASAVAAIAPSTVEFVSGDFQNSTDLYGGENYAFPQGRRVAGYQVIDDVSYTKGRNTIRWGYNFRRDNISDIQGEETINPISLTTEEDFGAGVIDYEYLQRFPQRPTEPVAVYNQGAYVEDSIKLTPTLTLTAGFRMERNSNPTCQRNCFTRLATDVYSVSGATNVPYSAAYPNGLIQSDRHRAFKQYQKFAALPRVGFNWAPTEKTVVRGGFGLFADTFPGVIADDLLSNAPTNYHALVYGTATGIPGSIDQNYDPSTAGSGSATATASAVAFQNGFYKGESEAGVAADVALVNAHFSTPSLQTVAGNISYPTYEEFSLAVEQRINNKSSISMTYVGNHGYHEPVQDGTRNLSNSSSQPGFFPTVPAAKPIGSFATLTNTYSGASSNFNGVVISAVRRSRDLTVNFNYEFSKALDEISNGGLEPFAPDAGDSGTVQNPTNLHQQYGPADYNVKHNITSSFVYELPKIWSGWHNALGGFEFSGDFFHQSGLPYTVGQDSTSFPKTLGALTVGAFANGSVNLFAHQLNNNFDHHCGGGQHALLPDGSAPNPCNFKGSFTTPSNFGQGSRNSLVGPSYTNVDFGAFKTFGVPWIAGMKLKVGAQFFNLFNHPNFQNPDHVYSSSNTQIGAIESTVGAPTSILGSTGGADASPRLIQLHGELRF